MTAAHPPIQSHPDLATVRALLAADLTAAHLDDFWGCSAGSELIGVIGLELRGSAPDVDI